MKYLKDVKYLVVILLSACSIISVHAQSRAELAHQYVQLPAVQAMMRDVISPETFASQIEAGLPSDFDITSNQKKRIGNLMAEKMAPLLPKLEQQMIKAAAEIYTVAELQALIEFHSSDLGVSILSKSADFMTASMGEVQQDIMQVSAEAIPEIISILEE